MNYNDEFDQVLDDALAEYRDAEPLAGMEQRVLRRAQLQAERPKTWMRWSAFATCAAMFAMVTWIGLRERGRNEIAPVQPVAAKQAEPQVDLATNDETAHAAQAARTPTRPLVVGAVHVSGTYSAGQATASSRERTPMLPQFPSPAPPNWQERALLTMAQTHPEVLTELASKQDDQEIAIVPINIEPLVKATASNQGEN